MEEYNQYKQPPLEEVIFEARVETNNQLSDINSLEIFAKNFEELYPEKRTIYTFTAEGKPIDGSNEIEFNATNAIQGYQCWSEDKKKVISITKNSFSFANLKPYIGWNDISLTFLKEFKKYIEYFNPSYLKRLAVRNVNKITLEKDRLEELINTTSKTRLKQEYKLNGFLNQNLFICNRYKDINIRVVETIQDDNNNSLTNFVLDIDVFSTKTRKIDENMQSEESFRQIRDVKNQIFESFLTHEIRETFS